jgi:GTP-binding protein
MEIRKAIFTKSAASLADCPKNRLPEFAFIGRSNVGKSSLINMLCNNSKLAKTSATPGKTQLINHFLINDSWYLVDLPGYGYAKTGQSKKESFQRIIYDYCTKRENLVCLFVLIDSRLPLQAIDFEFLTWCSEKKIPFSIIYTKSDKSGKTTLTKNIDAIEKELLEQWEELPNTFLSSAEKKTGRVEILGFIAYLLSDKAKSHNVNRPL